MVELTLTEDSLSPEALDDLMHKATKTLMWWEKLPDEPEARKIAWSMVNQLPKAHFFVGGRPAEKPRYRFRVHTIQGLMSQRAKQGVMRDLTKLALEAEGAAMDLDNMSRVWVIFREYSRDDWGIAGAPFAPSGYVTSLDEINTDPMPSVDAEA
ncbi:tautomerase family protein [Ruegeria jejuensis]|uniref:tautomerase family protein n=1 Tax=Ruegeria jejuensis TaxID=3233338 RepID=UPI00355B2838